MWLLLGGGRVFGANLRTYHVISSFNIERIELSGNVVSSLILVDNCAHVFSWIMIASTQVLMGRKIDIYGKR